MTKILKHRVQGGTFYLPAAYHQEAYRGGKLARTDEGGIEEESVEIDVALPSELFRLEAQPGEMVVDRGLVSTPSQTPVQLSIPGIRDFFGARTSFTSERGDSMEVKVVFGQELERFWGMSLCGGPLPGWDGIQLDRKSIENQAVLVCFWDMNQRPSRRCLDVLAAQGEALKQKGVVVISVQVAPVEEGTLQAWLKEHGVPGVVGMVRGEVEKLRSAWAVPSLPWLILADRRHVVRAEGFSADTLTEVLSTLSTP